MLGRPVQSAATAVVVTAALIGAGYGLQRAVVRTPTKGELVAARVELALLRYRFSHSTIHIAGEPVRQAECFEGWVRRPHRRSYTRGAQLLFSDGERIEVTAAGARRTAAGSVGTQMPPVAEVELAGCGHILTNHIYSRLVAKRRTAAVDADFMGRPALSLHVRTKRDRLDLFVDPGTLEPLGLRVETAHDVGWSVVDPVRPLTPAVKQDFLRRFYGD